MLRAYSVPEVRAAEQQAMADLPAGTLMQRAATALARVVADRARAQQATDVVVLVGPGDNGGDALYAAAQLVDEVQVTVVHVGEKVHPGGLQAVRERGLPVLPVARAGSDLPVPVRQALAQADLVVDGLVGIGGRPGLAGAMAALAAAIPPAARVVAVDLPSGADPEGVEPLAAAVRADETVTFSLLKPVHLLPATRAAVGRLTLVDIGVSAPADVAVEQLTAADVPIGWPVPGPQDHKYSRGVVSIVAGSDAYPGAAVLCSTAAVETGAGMVRYLGPKHATDLVLASCPEVVPGPGRAQAAVVGPGIDPQGGDHPECDDHQVDRVRKALAEDLPLVVDAGALHLLAAWQRQGGRRGAATLLTPHAGELAQLLTTIEGNEVRREQVEQAPLSHARRAARATGCTVLLKGATTLIVDPDPAVPTRVQSDAPAWLATAGAGDVLAGLAGTLLAAGLGCQEAGSLAALVHGLAAHAANPGGPVRALAVARAIPHVVAGLLADRSAYHDGSAR